MKKPHLGILLKPTSYDCNMRCDYCYYRGVQDIYSEAERPRMSAQVFDAVCQQYRAMEPSEIKIGWQGGEPTLMGVEFFRDAVQTEARHSRAGDCWGNTLQTNGVVLDEEWCRFLARNKFLVGLSVDGPPELNRLRRFRNGRPTHKVAMRALELLKRHACEFNTLVVVSQANVEHPETVFQFLVDNAVRFSQCIPCTEPAGGAGQVTEHSITPAQWAEFMIGFFEAWVEADEPGYYNRHIDNWLHLYFHLPPESCEYRPDCSNLVTVEWNGDVYPCDFFVEERYRLGNVLEDTIEHMIQSRTFRDFVSRAEQTPSMCGDCEWLWACHGGCYRQRGKLGLGPEDQPYMCEANRRIFRHVFATLDRLKERSLQPRLHRFLSHLDSRLSRQAQGPDPARALGRPAGSPRGHTKTGRNDPCPCGSGKKFKNCCFRSVASVDGRHATAAGGGRRETVGGEQ